MKINKDTLSQIGNLLEQENWGKLSSKNGLYLSFARPVKGTDWIMIMAISSSYLWSILLSILFIWLLMFLILVLSYRYFEKQYTNQMLRKIYLLEENMNNLLHEEFTQIEYTDKEHDELDYLICYYNSILQKFQTLFYNKIRDEQEKRRLELSLIQEQINPHFLYNTLDSITWMVEGGRNDEAVFMISQLAKFFRISLSQGCTVISIKDELQHAESYMNIQKVRYKNSFSIVFDIDPDVCSCCTVKLILQPILENAIAYGVSGMDDCGEIRVTGRIQEGSVILSVTDNGIGMSEEEVRFLLTDSGRVRKHGSGVGLVNVNNRIQILFGKEYGISVESEPDEGTTVSVCLPAVPYTEENRKILEKGHIFNRDEMMNKEM